MKKLFLLFPVLGLVSFLSFSVGCSSDEGEDALMEADQSETNPAGESEEPDQPE